MDELGFSSLLDAQAGVFTRLQAMAFGVSARDAARATAEGEWSRAAGRGFTLKSTDIGDTQLAWAAALSMPDAVVWGASALRLWLPDGPVKTPYLVNVAVSSHRRAQFRIRPRTICVPPGEVSMWAGVRVQTRDAALVDSLATLPQGEADSLLSWAVVRKLVSASNLEELVDRRRGQRGARRLRAYLDMWRSGAASHAEVVFHALMNEHGVTGWEPNVALFLSGYGTASVDVLFRKEKLAVEIDGWEFHHSRTAFQEDRTKQNALTQAGYRVFRFTWEDLTSRTVYCVRQIQQARRAACPPPTG
jgi:hypothetical protein